MYKRQPFYSAIHIRSISEVCVSIHTWMLLSKRVHPTSFYEQLHTVAACLRCTYMATVLSDGLPFFSACLLLWGVCSVAFVSGAKNMKTHRIRMQCSTVFYTRIGSNKGKTPEHNQVKHTKHPHSLEWHNSTITIVFPSTQCSAVCYNTFHGNLVVERPV